MAKKNETKKPSEPSVKVFAKRHFHHSGKSFQPGQELSQEELDHCSESREELMAEGLVEEVKGQE